jgi:putative NADPH-quinone reductase
MRALVVYCHPRADSFTAAVRNKVMASLQEAGVEAHLIDLYGEGFNPVMSAEDHRRYENIDENRNGLEAHIEQVKNCDTLIFVFPTWWYNLPAMLKGWLDRTLVPGVAFDMPCAEHKNIRPGLRQIRKIGVFTTCGASRWLSYMIGEPGRRTLLRGLRGICSPTCRTVFVAHYSIDSSTSKSRAAHLSRVEAKMRRFIGKDALMSSVGS